MTIRASSLLLACALAFGLATPSSAAPPPFSPEEAREAAVDAYLYAYPLVLMEATRRVTTNGDAGIRRPANQFANVRAFPDATFTDVVRANVDTLYSSLWFDVSQEPLVIAVPDSGGRYYLLPMLDLWTDVFASPGKRTSGTGPQIYAITGPGWSGTLPKDVTRIEAPTATGWMIGRTQTNGKADYAAVHAFQDGLRAVPLSQWGKPYQPPKGKVDPSVDMSAPVEQVAKLSAAKFFAAFADLTRANPPHLNDGPVLQRMARLGLVPGRPFDLAKASPEAKAALEAAPAAAQAKIAAFAPHAADVVDGWGMLGSPIGTYGTDYLKRAFIAYMGLGANVVEDAIYPTARLQVDGKPFDSSARYTVRFTKQQLPPARAFWSLTLYNDKQFLAANPIDRFAIGDRDALKFNADGSLDLYIQRDSPGKEHDSNWLPTPANGSFSMNLRLYWPRPEALDGTWTPPAVKRLD
jgi:hypothetical protein